MSGVLRPAVAGAFLAAGVVVVVLVVLFVPAVHNRVIGGGADQASTESRRIQWELATPKILANPITGHGFGLGGDIVGYRSCNTCLLSVDSFVLSALAETGILGLVTFFGALLVSAYFGMRRYIFDRTWPGSLAGGLACALIAYSTNKLVLSQRENVTVANIMVCCIMFLNYHYIKDKVTSAARLSKSAMRRGGSDRNRRKTEERTPTSIPAVASQEGRIQQRR